MKSTKENHYIREILKILLQKEIIATSEIASVISLSEKATRNKIDHIQQYLQEHHLGSIEKKPRIGIWLQADDQQKEKLWKIIDHSDQVNVGYTSGDRMRETLRLFFRMMPRETITTQHLADELYLSTPTMLKVLKDCENWLNAYHITINNERNRGYSLVYDEANYRIAL